MRISRRVQAGRRPLREIALETAAKLKVALGLCALKGLTRGPKVPRFSDALGFVGTKVCYFGVVLEQRRGRGRHVRKGRANATFYHLLGLALDVEYPAAA